MLTLAILFERMLLGLAHDLMRFAMGSGGAFGVGAKRLNGAQKAKAATAALSVSMCMNIKHGPYVRAPYLFVVSWLNVSKLQIAVLFSV